MSDPVDFPQYLAFINHQLRPNATAVLSPDRNARWRGITISRQSGTGAHLVAEQITRILQNCAPQGTASWMLFDRNLLERVLTDHQLPARLAKYMPEDRISGIEDTLDELFGLHPPTWKLVEKTSDTILRLAELGNVILLGRGANVVTSKLGYMFHVRLVGAREERIEFVQKDRNVDHKTATEIVDHEDEGRRRYVKRYFHRDVNDPTLYHLVINTTELGHVMAARLVADTILTDTSTPHTAHAAHG